MELSVSKNSFHDIINFFLYLGYVFEAFDQNRQCKVALKRTQKAGNIISREFEILDMLRGSENVIQMLDFFYSLDSK